MKQPNIKPFLALSVLFAFLTSCPRAPDANPPVANITLPAQDQVLSGTVTVQIDARDSEGALARVNVYARDQGSSKKGVLVGSTISKPYVVTWNTSSASGVPNQLNLELIAEAVDRSGNVGASPPVRVRTQNAGAPTLSLVAAFTYPPQVSLASTKGKLEAPPENLRLPFSLVTPPEQVTLEQREQARAALQTVARGLRQSVSDRKFAEQWEWLPVLNADGYGIFAGTEQLVGSYSKVRSQAADTSAALQVFSKFIDMARVGDTVIGAVTSLSNGAAVESAKSNADAGMFLPAQDAGAPVNDAVTDSKPTLTWTTTPGVIGYHYFVYDSDPFDRNIKANIKCSNFPKTTAALLVVYPIPELNGAVKCNPLTPGTYYWLVVGVSFDALDKADGFSYSPPQRFKVQ
jgi:Bacterial Ig domain